MKVYINARLARQVEGELVFLVVDKVFTNREKANEFYKNELMVHYADVQGVNCFIERSIIESEVEE